MQKIYINYANADFSVQQSRNSHQAKTIGKVDRVISYFPDDIDKDFYNENKKILNKVRGGGYWLWKFYIVHKTLTNPNVKNGDVIFYADSGTDVLKDLAPVFDLPAKYNSDILLFSYGPQCRNFTKRDAFILMDSDEVGAYDFPMCAGGFNVWRKSDKAIQFIEQCLHYATQFQIISDSTSKLGEDLPEFQMHRHDQCVFSMVAYKNNVKLISNENEKIYGTSVANAMDKNIDFNDPETYLAPNRMHNRNWWKRFKYKIAMKPEKFTKQGGFWGYVKYKLGIKR